jgi:hypothetical protein
MTDLFRARWTNQIHDEWIRGVLSNRPDLKRRQLERTRRLMNSYVLDCLVTSYEGLINTIKLPDPGDRHVLAAAIHAGANVIVTFNLNDFPAKILNPHGIVPQHPDVFIMHLLKLDPGAVCAAARRQRLSLRHPPKTIEEFLDILARQRLPQTVANLRKFSANL